MWIFVLVRGKGKNCLVDFSLSLESRPGINVSLYSVTNAMRLGWFRYVWSTKWLWDEVNEKPQWVTGAKQQQQRASSCGGYETAENANEQSLYSALWPVEPVPHSNPTSTICSVSSSAWHFNRVTIAPLQLLSLCVVVLRQTRRHPRRVTQLTINPAQVKPPQNPMQICFKLKEEEERL